MAGIIFSEQLKAKYKGIKLLNPEEFNPIWLKKYKRVKKPVGNQRTRKRVEYLDCVCAFDIETTVIDELKQAVMYVWQMSINNDYVIIGREWDEFLTLMEKMAKVLNDDMYLVFYDHNLSYEFQFLRGLYPFGMDEVFALKSHKVLKCTMNKHMELRCSYMLTSTKLGKFCKDMQVEHKKVDTRKFDYTIKRYPWTPWDSFSEDEQEYMLNDVVGLVEAVKQKMAHSRDTLHTIPMTSTGYVRREAKEAMSKVRASVVEDILPEFDTYCLLREAFRGGDTHANRYYSGDILRITDKTPWGVKSYDRSSSYPDVIVHCPFPISTFMPFSKNATFDDVIKAITKRNRAVVCRLRFWNINLSDPMWPMPYLAKAKCRHVVNGVFDNGRIISADYLETTVTDVDLKIITSTYEFGNVELIDGEYARYGKLPKELTNLVIKYYKGKTELKDVPGRELDYALMKALLNAIYGMMAQDPVRADVFFDIADGFEVDASNAQGKLEKYNRTAFLPYQWGVWTTAWARYRLFESYLMTGHGTVYADTDSNKYLDDPENPVDWTEFNNARIADCLESGAYATDPQGVTHYMGVFEEETPEQGLYEFKTLGAKKYVYRKTKDSDLVITIAGVPKSDGAGELDKAGGLEAFEDGFTFREGKNGIIYNDENYGYYEIDGHKIFITANAAIVPAFYTVGITDEYCKLITESHEYMMELVNIALDKMKQ